MPQIFNNNKLFDGTYKELTWLYMEYNKVTMKRLGTYDNFSAHFRYLLEDLLGIILKSLCLRRDELGIEFGHSDVLCCLSVDSLTSLSCDCSESAETRAGVSLYLNTIAGGSLTEESLHSLVVGSFMEALNELA